MFQIRVIDFLLLHSMSWDLEHRSKECLPSLPNERVGSDGAIVVLFLLRCNYSNLREQGWRYMPDSSDHRPK